MKKAKGFTLVELVVVIAIIGVLAAILIPSMLGYVKKARLKAANTNAKTAYNAVSEFIADKVAEGMERDEAISCYASEVIDCASTPSGTGASLQAKKAVYNALSENGVNSGKVWVDQATINNTDSFYVQWTNDSDPTISTAIFGQYPDAITWDNYDAGNAVWKTYNNP